MPKSEIDFMSDPEYQTCLENNDNIGFKIIRKKKKCKKINKCCPTLRNIKRKVLNHVVNKLGEYSENSIN